MKMIKRVGILASIFVMNFYNICFADLVPIDPWEHIANKRIPENNIMKFILIGLAIAVIAILITGIAILITRQKKKNKVNIQNK